MCFFFRLSYSKSLEGANTLRKPCGSFLPWCSAARCINSLLIYGNRFLHHACTDQASASSAPVPSASECCSAEDQLKHLLQALSLTGAGRFAAWTATLSRAKAEWARLQGREESIRRDALSTHLNSRKCRYMQIGGSTDANRPVGQFCERPNYR